MERSGQSTMVVGWGTGDLTDRDRWGSGESRVR